MRRRRFLGIAAAVTVLALGLTAALLGGLGLLPAWKNEWAIAIYTGPSPLDLASPAPVRNPVLTARDVRDVSADFVADPFMVRRGSTWYMFFEVMNAGTGQGDIGLATSEEGLKWTYRQIVLDEPFHVSYPCVFEWEGTYYMTPETHQVRSVRLYKGVDFPFHWAFVGRLVEGQDFVDPSMCRHGGLWWLFVGTAAERHDTLRLYYAEGLSGPFREHPRSPIVAGDANTARPGGRVLTVGGRIIRFAQDDDPTYGNQVRAFEVTSLSRQAYEDREVSESPILAASGRGWNGRGMHHVDPHPVEGGGWMACVDGYRKVLAFGLRR